MLVAHFANTKAEVWLTNSITETVRAWLVGMALQDDHIGRVTIDLKEIEQSPFKVSSAAACVPD